MRRVRHAAPEPERAWKGRAIAVALLAALAASPARGEEGGSYLELSTGFKSGDFGTSTRSDLYYVAPTLGYAAPRYDYSVTVPYLSLRAETAGQSMTEHGVGDAIVRGGRELAAGGGWSLYGAAAAKLPTADETRGLGTGKADLGAFATLGRDLESVRLSLLAGYIKVGDPPGQALRDVRLYGVGLAGWAGTTRVYGSLEGRTASVPGADNPLELNLGAVHPLSAQYWLRGAAFAGLNDGGPRFGASLGVVRWF